MAEEIVCDPDPHRHVEAIREFREASFDQVYISRWGRTRKASFGSTSERSCLRCVLAPESEQLNLRERRTGRRLIEFGAGSARRPYSCESR